MTHLQERGGTPETEARIALPWPPSVNMLYTNVKGRGRVPTGEYTAWKREAGWTLKAQKPPKFKGPVSVGIELNPPHKRRFDLDNRMKCCLDLLVTHEILPDDNSGVVTEVSVRRVDAGAPCTVVVRSVIHA